MVLNSGYIDLIGQLSLSVSRDVMWLESWKSLARFDPFFFATAEESFTVNECQTI